MQQISDFLISKHYELLPYQQDVLDAFNHPTNGIIEAPTGRGKTMAIALGIISNAIKQNKRPKILWVTPMRALARDTAFQLEEIFKAFFDDIQIILRTSDSSNYQKKKARDNKWDILITTPESCALFSTYSDMHASLSAIDVLVVDEWHVLMHQKRGILFELFMSWLSMINKSYCRWALSATIASADDAANLLSPNQSVKQIKDSFKKPITGTVLLPKKDDQTFRLLGKKMAPQIIEQILQVSSAIIFTNTRSQSEQWYQLLLESGEFKKSELNKDNWPIVPFIVKQKIVHFT